MKIEAVVLDALGSPRPYTESRPLRLEELELDPPGEGELLVRIAAAGVCHSDLSVVDGSRPRPVPIALGHEAAGVVEAVGTGVRDVHEGDHVVLTFVPSCGMCGDCTGGRPALCLAAARSNAEGRLLGGGSRLHRDGTKIYHHLGVSAFAENVVVSRCSAVVIPDDIPFDIAAMFGCAILTGVGAVLHTARVRAGESVAVFGLGGVGLAAIMGAALAGAGPIVGVDPVESKRSLAKELGATLVLTPEDAEEAIREFTGDGAEATFETAGRVEAFGMAYRSTRRGGTTVAVGLPHPAKTFELAPAALVGEGRTVIGSYMGSSVPQRDIPRLLGLWQDGRLPVQRLRCDTVGLSDLNQAMEALAGGEVLRQIVEPSQS